MKLDKIAVLPEEEEVPSSVMVFWEKKKDIHSLLFQPAPQLAPQRRQSIIYAKLINVVYRGDFWGISL